MIPTSFVPLNPKIKTKTLKLGIGKKLTKAIKLFQQNPSHPSLNIELLEPKHLGIWSFRVDRKVRAIFAVDTNHHIIEIIDVTIHYH